MKYLSIVFIGLLLTFSCKKDEKANLCSNGFKDIGEAGVDCGGTCSPCVMNYLPNLYLKLNGTPITFVQNSFSQSNNDWYLNCSNDSIQIQINLGPSIEVGNYIIQPTNTFATINGSSYPFIVPSNAVIAITENFEDDLRISGLFQAKFYQTGSFDTMFVSSGEFVHLPY